MNDYIYIITALLPLVAIMLILQTNPYHALVIRGVLGAIAALVYTVLGAADVALTEALVGTLLAISLYAVSVRSSLVFRLGVLKDEIEATRQPDATPANQVKLSQFKQVVDELRTVFRKHYMRVELVSYLYPEDLRQAMLEKEIHAFCVQSHASSALSLDMNAADQPAHPYLTTTRLPRLYDILKAELSSTLTRPTYANLVDLQETPS
jgi:putative multicomponent Na+:H+ antiporter subunit B